jgi:electron transport complex protein RnfG
MATRESNFKNMVLTLMMVTGVAALALGGVYNLTKEPIAAAKKAKLESAIGTVLPAFTSIETQELMPLEGKDPLTFYVAKSGDEVVGTAIQTYSDKGFTQRIWIMVGFLPDGTIFNTAVLDHKETPGLGDKMDISKSPWSEQFRNKMPGDFDLKVTKDGGDVDAITAATISSRAFCDAVNRAWDTYQKEGGTKE